MKTIINLSQTAKNYLGSNTIQLLVSGLLLFFTLFSANLQAQDTFPKTSFGLRVGGNANSWTNEFPSFEYQGIPIYPDDWKATYGMHLGAYINVRLSTLVAIEPGFLYTAKGTGAILNTGDGIAEGKVISNYIDIPFLLRLYVSDGFNLFLGPQLSYHLNSNFEATLDNTTVIPGEDVSDGISELDVSAVLGLGYEFNSGLNFNLSGELGLLSVDGYEILNTYNRTIRFSIGYSF